MTRSYMYLRFVLSLHFYGFRHSPLWRPHFRWPPNAVPPKSTTHHRPLQVVPGLHHTAHSDRPDYVVRSKPFRVCTKPPRSKPAHYWLRVMARYTGARMNQRERFTANDQPALIIQTYIYIYIYIYTYIYIYIYMAVWSMRVGQLRWTVHADSYALR